MGADPLWLSGALGIFAFQERCMAIVLGSISCGIAEGRARDRLSGGCPGESWSGILACVVGPARATPLTRSPSSFRLQGWSGCCCSLLSPHCDRPLIRPGPFSQSRKTKAGPPRKGLLSLNIYPAAPIHEDSLCGEPRRRRSLTLSLLRSMCPGGQASLSSPPKVAGLA